MEKSNKRGKIPQTDWPLIMGRYEAGETLSSIARTYDCSPPAISYIVSRSRGKALSGTTAAPAEPQLIKAPGNGHEAPSTEALAAPLAPAPVSEVRIPAAIHAEPRPEMRRKLHLSLGGSAPAPAHSSTNGHGNVGGNGHIAETGAGNARPSFVVPAAAALNPMAERASLSPNPGQSAHNGHDFAGAAEIRPAAQQARDETARKDSAAFIDHDLRNRVDGDIAAFLAAFDAALAADTQESRFSLREATDRLLRAGARTRIELERLEARVPLSSREGAEASPGAAAWRYR